MTPVNLVGTDKLAFYNAVWDIVRQIPPGKVATYGQIAAYISPPEGMEMKTYRSFSPRWVGGAMAACPSDVPWQRIINSQGKISVRGESAIKQRQLLEQEGIEFSERGSIDLKRYQWHGNESGNLQLELPFG